jgi:hypothetical protein
VRSSPARRTPTRSWRPRGRPDFTWRRGVAPFVVAVLARGGRNGPLGQNEGPRLDRRKALEGPSPGELGPRGGCESGAVRVPTRGGSKASKQTKPPERGESGARGPGRRGSRGSPRRKRRPSSGGEPGHRAKSVGVSETRRTRPRASHLRYDGGELHGSKRRREAHAIPARSNALKGEPHGRQRHETRPRSSDMPGNR